MTELTPSYFLQVLYDLLTAPGAFETEVNVFKGLRSNITGEYTLQIYPTNFRETTRAENVLACTDSWQIAGVVSVSEEEAVDKTISFMQAVKAALDKLAEMNADFTYALLQEAPVSYENFPYVVFNLQVDISYIRRINNGI